jgi:acetyltransferase-like isoleucine patch superfamily enzyme
MLEKRKFTLKNSKKNLYKSFSSGVVNVVFGKRCEIIEPVNLYGCKIGNDVFVGPFVEITKGVEIGNSTRISSHSFVCELVKIGNKCFIGHGVMFTNDTFSNGKLGGGKKNWKKTLIGNNVLIGSNATILPVKINSGCVIGAGSVVTKDCLIKGIYAGNPARLIRKI